MLCTVPSSRAPSPSLARATGERATAVVAEATSVVVASAQPAL